MNSNNKLTYTLFLKVLKIIFTISIINICANTIFGFPFSVNLKWIGFSIITAITFYKTRKNLYFIWMFIYFLFVIYLMMPLSFFDSGGSSNNTIGYLFLIVICITFFFAGKFRIFLIFSSIFIFDILIVLEKHFPYLVKNYSSETQFFDRIFQISILLFMSFSFLKKFSDAYVLDKEKLDKLAKIDSLTGLLNRRSFDMKMQEILDLKSENEKYLLFIDIDNFKSINDSYGHHYGDQIILQLSKKLKNIFSKNGIISRWGGDEFAVIYNNSFENLSSILKELYDQGIQLSCGITPILKSDCSVDQVVRRADSCLYEAKESGKNKWIFKG